MSEELKRALHNATKALIACGMTDDVSHIEALLVDGGKSEAVELEALRKDAERYRFIRRGLSDHHGDVYAMVFAGDGDYPENGEALDRIVDSAIAAKKEKE